MNRPRIKKRIQKKIWQKATDQYAKEFFIEPFLKGIEWVILKALKDINNDKQ